MLLCRPQGRRMRLGIVVALMIALFAIAAYGVFAPCGQPTAPHSTADVTKGGAADFAASEIVQAAGHYDAAMSGVCQFSGVTVIGGSMGSAVCMVFLPCVGDAVATMRRLIRSSEFGGVRPVRRSLVGAPSPSPAPPPRC